AGLIHLARLKKLRVLFINDSRVTDSGLVHLKGLTQLAHLSLTGVPGVSDAGLVHLRRLNQLRELHVDFTNVSDEGLAALRAVVQSLAKTTNRKLIPDPTGESFPK